MAFWAPPMSPEDGSHGSGPSLVKRWHVSRTTIFRSELSALRARLELASVAPTGTSKRILLARRTFCGAFGYVVSNAILQRFCESLE